ncbi:PLP-dependent transferase, partial [Bacillus paralicheniformis]|uniref:PLP-dependent transferase n=1 Tax=Bacillus paralicheniformis TaxID=1648923 RepID=UPI00232DCB97
QHASTFHQGSFDKVGEYDYSRSGTPTRTALEDTIAELEGGTRGFAFSSGMAAISTAFLLLSKGDHVLVTKDVYGGTYR